MNNGTGWCPSRPNIGSPWRGLLYRWHVGVEHKPADEFNQDFAHSVKKVRSLIYDQTFGKLYAFLEFVAEDPRMGDARKGIRRALEGARAAWRLVDDQIVPVASEEEAGAVVKAVSETARHGPAGAKAHLRNASKQIAAGDWAGAVRESIHAVEAVARTFGEAKTLPDALKALQATGHPIHPALAKGLTTLYGYTSDESGVRHALIDTGASTVSESEALFMFGACASFCLYLVNVAKRGDR